MVSSDQSGFLILALED